LLSYPLLSWRTLSYLSLSWRSLSYPLLAWRSLNYLAFCMWAHFLNTLV
jgi:hypothetical protein